MAEKVLEFDGVSKLYALGKVGTGALGRDLTRWWKMSILQQEDPYMVIGNPEKHYRKGNSEFACALQDITFDVNAGEVIGIIGKNGAGKSTLLKILSRITAPTRGTIKTKGRVASFLEVGTGFHPDLTGRENVFMNGSILGMTRPEIKSKFDSIVDFAGMAPYIDTPVKRYSSGMKVRLGFAIAAHLEPEILIVDEVLAVGDAEFQKKAIGKMKSVSTDEGRTVLFVSHNMNAILQLCQRGIILNEGRLIFDGEAHDAVSNYLGTLSNRVEFNGIDGDSSELLLSKASVSSSQGMAGGVFDSAMPMDIEMEVEVKRNIPSLVIGFNLYSQYDYPLARADYNDVNQIKSLEPGHYRFTFRIPPYTLAPGSYKISFDVAERNMKRYTTDKSDLSFEVIADKSNFGYVFPDITPKKVSVIHENWVAGMERVL